MLILDRFYGQSIMIGDGVVVTVLGVNGLQVQIGVEAPREIPVNREEVWQRIQQEQDKNQ